MLEFGEDDDTSAGLEEALDLNFDVLADGGVAVVDDDHRAIGQVTDALAFVFALADDSEVEDFTGQKDDA